MMIGGSPFSEKIRLYLGWLRHSWHHLGLVRRPQFSLRGEYTLRAHSGETSFSDRLYTGAGVITFDV